MIPIILTAIEAFLPESIASLDYVAGALRLSRMANQAWDWSRTFNPSAVQVFSQVSDFDEGSQWASELEKFHLSYNLFASLMQLDVPSKDSPEVISNYISTAIEQVERAYALEPAQHSRNIIARAANGLGYVLTQQGYQILRPAKEYLASLPSKLTVLDPLVVTLDKAYSGDNHRLKAELAGLASAFYLDEQAMPALAKLYKTKVFQSATMTISQDPTSDDLLQQAELAATHTHWSSHSLNNETLHALIAKGAAQAEDDVRRTNELSPAKGLSIQLGLIPPAPSSPRRSFVPPTRAYITNHMIRRTDTVLTEDKNFVFDESSRGMVRLEETDAIDKKFSTGVLSEIALAASVSDYYKKVKRVGAPGRAIQRLETKIIDNVKNFIKTKK